MEKILIKPEDYEALVRECYESDKDHISKIHFYSDLGFEACIKNTARDAWIYNVQWYKVLEDNKTVGYFGHEVFNEQDWLTGFFIKPEFRKSKQDFWKVITDH